MRDDTLAALGSEIQKRNRKKDWGTVAKEAKRLVDSAWKIPDRRWGIVSGKEVLARLFGWCNAKFNVSISAMNLARNLTSDEIPPEVVGVLSAIELGQPFA